MNIYSGGFAKAEERKRNVVIGYKHRQQSGFQPLALQRTTPVSVLYLRLYLYLRQSSKLSRRVSSCSSAWPNPNLLPQPNTSPRRKREQLRAVVVRSAIR